jgi:hypothetical protein
LRNREAILPKIFARMVLVGFCALGLVACGPGEVTDSTPLPTPTGSLPISPTVPAPAVLAPFEGILEFAPSPVPRVAPIDKAVITPTPALAGGTTGPTLSPIAVPDPIFLQVFSPIDGSGVEVGATRVIGRTSAVTVDINGIPVDLKEDGSFQRDLPLREGVNLLEVVASTSSGRTKSEQVVVFMVAPIAALPFSLLYPFDGLEAATPTIQVIGVTKPDAVVGVNGIPVEVNGLGIFSTTLTLVEGDNLIEVVATDLREVRFQTVAVFYLPGAQTVPEAP